MHVELERVSHVYEPASPWQVTAIHDVSLAIAGGEAVGIIGATGSGKSTLVQHFNGLLKPASGRVLIDGRDLWDRQTNRRQVRHRIGLVFQYPEHQLFEETVRADVAFGPRNLGCGADEIDRRVRWALERVGLPEDLLDRSPFALSGGQMRRAAIAGTLAMRPEMLILDEPTAGLDPRGREEILGFVRELHRSQGLTVVIVSHNMEEVARLVDRVVVMHRGAVALDGPVREIYAQGDRLREIGLDLPFPARVADALNTRGFAVPRGLLSLAEAEEAIAAALPAARRAGGGDRA